MTDWADMTHEELAGAAARIARQRGDNNLAEMARRLQRLVDDEAPSMALAREIIRAIDA
jgi:hypothetical protein